MTTEKQSAYNDQDASSNWSGFNYQGKVAIYIALYLINNPKHADKTETEGWDLYSLEIEGLEDFSILKKGEYVSIHQVKAYTSGNTPSKLTNAFWGLIGKSIEHETIKKSCLHTLKEVPKLRENSNDNIKYIKNLDPSKDKEKDYKKSYKTDEDSLTKAFGKLAFYNTHKSYKLCVPLDNINKLIIDEIRTYYSKNGYEEYKLNEEYLERVLNNILGKIDEHVYKRHNKDLTQYDHINFSDVINYITEVPDSVSHNYNLYHLKREIMDTTLEYCEGCIDDTDYSIKCETCNLKLYNEHLKSLDNLQFIAFLSRLNINIELNKNKLNTKGIIEIFKQISGYNDLLERIEENKNFNGIENNKINHKVDNDNYINTSISHTKTTKKQKEIERRNISQGILNNIDKDIEFMISIEESSGLISHDVDIESVKKLANKIGKSNDTSTDEKMDELLPQYDRLNGLKDISVISHEKINQIGETCANV